MLIFYQFHIGHKGKILSGTLRQKFLHSTLSRCLEPLIGCLEPIHLLKILVFTIIKIENISGQRYTILWKINRFRWELIHTFNTILSDLRLACATPKMFNRSIFVLFSISVFTSKRHIKGWKATNLKRVARQWCLISYF